LPGKAEVEEGAEGHAGLEGRHDTIVHSPVLVVPASTLPRNETTRLGTDQILGLTPGGRSGAGVLVDTRAFAALAPRGFP
jgi:hypothetical protein